MALAEPNMEDCNPKEKCLSGDNAGLAYTPGKECDIGFEFNVATCDCDSIIPSCGDNVNEHGKCQGFLYVRFDWNGSSYQRYEYNWQYGEGYYQCDRYKTIFGVQYCDWDYYLPVSYTTGECGNGECIEQVLKVGSCNGPQNPYCTQQEPTVEVHGPNWSGGPESEADWPDSCNCEREFTIGYYCYAWEPNWEESGEPAPRQAMLPQLVDPDDGGKLTINGYAIFACQVDSTLPNGASIDWYEGPVSASYMSQTDPNANGCSLSVGGSTYCTDSTAIWPFYTCSILTREGGNFNYALPYQAGIPCNREPKNSTRTATFTIIYGETYAECDAARTAYLNG